jgi:hypothetical protein
MSFDPVASPVPTPTPRAFDDFADDAESSASLSFPSPMPLPTPTPAPDGASADAGFSGLFNALGDFFARDLPDGTTDYLGGLANSGPPGPAGCGSHESGGIPDVVLGRDLSGPCAVHDAEPSWNGKGDLYDMLAANSRIGDGVAAVAADGLLPERLFFDAVGEFYEFAVDTVAIVEKEPRPLVAGARIAVEATAGVASTAVRAATDVGVSAGRLAKSVLHRVID